MFSITTRIPLWTLAAAIATLPVLCLAADREETVVFEHRTDGYDAFRIPAIVATTEGTLLAFCEGRVKDAGDSGDVDVVLKRSVDGGKTWGPLIKVADAGSDTIGNPCPVVVQESRRILLPMTRNHGKNSNAENKRGTGVGTREVFLATSDDDGQAWSQPKNITASVKPDDWTWYATGPGCGIELDNGRIVIPCNHRVKGKPDRNSISHVIFSDDGGETWSLGGSVPEEKTNESQVVQLSDDSLLLNMRSHHGKNRRAVSRSIDRGETWGAVTFDETLIDPTCQASLIALPVGADGNRRFVFANPASEKRENLTLRVSNDDCRTWPEAITLHAGSAGYSSLVALSPSRVGCLYEQGKSERIVFVPVELDRLQKASD